MSHAQANVSVIVPVFNGEAFIRGALESIFSQTLSPREIIVVDDGSDDGTPGILKSIGAPHLRVIHQGNQGSGAARNRALKAATSPIIAFLDADDLWLNNTLSVQMKALERAPDSDLVFGQVEEFEHLEAAPSEMGPPLSGFLPSAMVAKRSAFERVGSFNIDRALPDFGEWFLRAKDLGLSIHSHGALVARRRLHKANRGRTLAQAHLGYVRILKQSLDRRRRHGRKPRGDGQ